MNYFQNNYNPNDIQILDPADEKKSRKSTKVDYDAKHRERMVYRPTDRELYEREDR